jgi:hypothetical protein
MLMHAILLVLLSAQAESGTADTDVGILRSFSAV